MGGGGSRGRRSLLAGLALALVATAGSLYVSSSTEERATREAVRASRLAAQLKLASVLTEEDLETPAGDTRYGELRGSIDRVMPDEIVAVTLWSATGRILYHDDAAMIGTRPSYPREFLDRVANGSTETKTEAGLLKTFVPIWVEPGGTIGVAELDRPLGPIRATARLWRIAAFVFGGLALLVLIRLAMGLIGRSEEEKPSRRFAGGSSGMLIGPRPMAPPKPTTVSAPAVSAVRPASAPAPTLSTGRRAETSAVAPADDGAAATRLERERDEALARAEAAERTFRTLETQHLQSLDQIAALEARLASGSGTSHAQGEVQALRDQVRDTAERLYRAEEENRALKVRLSEVENPLTPSEGLTAQLREIAHDRLATGG